MPKHQSLHQGPGRRAQGGAALVLALVFLIILTVLAITNMREVALESRIVGNLVDQKACFNAAEAGLRDAEYRIAGAPTSSSPGSYPPLPVTRYAEGVYSLKPPNAVQQCSGDLAWDDVCVLDQDPTFSQAFEAGEAGFAGAKSYSPDNNQTEFRQEIVWYAVPFQAGAESGESEVPEYGAAAAGLSNVRHEINARANDNSCEARLRSTVLRVYN